VRILILLAAAAVLAAPRFAHADGESARKRNPEAGRVELLVGPTLAYRRMFHAPNPMGGVDFRAGAYANHFAIHAELGYELGSAGGLGTRRFHIGLLAEGEVARFRFGGGIDAGERLFQRATSRDFVGTGLWSPFLVASADLTRWQHGALVLGLRVGVDFGTTNRSLFVEPGASLLLGVRFF
jgi:hypothetical protein